MTDNEIIKALECCSEYTGKGDCEGCPLERECGMNVIESLALDLINRQKAEIERLNTIIRDRFLENNKQILKAQDEAIKEFAERLKEGEVYMRIEFPNTRCGTETYVVLSDEIDNLVKEMESE